MSSIGDFQLPGGWKLLSLDCLGKAITGNTPPTKNPENYGGDIPFIKPTELVNRPVSMARETISAIGAEKSRILPKGGVLVSCIGNLGKTGIAKRDVAFNQQINAVVFNEIVVPEYGFYYFQTSKFRHDLESLASATTISIVNKSKFESIKVPIAPIEQQKRIVTKIEELFTHIDAGIASLQAAKKLLKQYRQSVLKAAVTGELTKDWRKANKDKLEPASQLLERILKERRQRWEEQQQLEQFKAKGKLPKDDKWKKKYQEPVKRAGDFEIPEEWVWATYSQLGEWIGGGTPSKAKKIYWTDGTIPWVSPKDMKSDYISDSEDRITEKAVNETVAKMIPKDSLLFVVRSGILRRILPVGLSKVDCSINQDLKALVPTNTQVSEFLLKNALALSQEIRNSCQRGGTTVESIEVSKLQVYSIPLPPLHEQYVIVNFVDEKFVAIERLENILDEQLLKAERKKLSILTSAFNGNL